MQTTRLIKLGKIAALAFANAAIALVLLEITLQIIFSLGWDAEKNHKPLSRPLQKIYWVLKPHTSWEEYFSINHANGADLIYANLHQPHPTRGWSMIPNAQRPGFTINQQGYRALYNFENSPEKYQVLIVGDSFTFGDDIDDEHTWPQLLQQQSKQLNVFNMGGSGYGTDQMLITLQEEIKHYQPDLVIAAFIDDDLKRAMIPFRDYKKPRFLLHKEKLFLTNTPIGDIAETLQEISQKTDYSFSRLQILNLYHYFTSDLTLMEAEPDTRKTAKLNKLIFENMQALAAENHAEFMLVYLPNGDELAATDFNSPGEVFFNNHIKEHSVHALNPRTELLAAPFAKSSGHYGSNENTLISQLVMKKIRELASWQKKEAP